MKYKKLTKNQIKISIDRLTRFKPTGEKYLRVFSDIITSALIEPKLKKSEILNLEYPEIKNLAVTIFNSSLPTLSKNTDINDYLKEYETNTFIVNGDTLNLLDNDLDFKSALSYIEFDDVLNLKWISNISKTSNPIKIRKTNKILYPIEKVIIAEGITEEILLPEFSKQAGYDFDENGIKIISAGGKNQVVKLYYKMCEELKLPIFVLLDKDAQSNSLSIEKKLRPTDKIHLLNSGEFEDLLSKKLIVKTVNNEFKNFVKIKTSDLKSDTPTVKMLEELFKEKCLHEFKKAEFAQRIKQQISSEKDISDELYEIINEIKQF